MFLVNLSSNLLRICSIYTPELSYEKAAELCQCSSKHFSNIVNKRTQPSLHVLENICNGFHLTPNDLLYATAIIPEKELAFRVPMPVVDVHFLGNFPFPVCPQCKRTLERESMSYCDRCGQCLDWNDFYKSTTT